MSTPILHVIVASTRPGRVGLPVAQWVTELATSHPAFDVELIDLAEVDLPLFNEPRHPRLGDYEFDATKAWSASVARADAFVFVTPEYNHSFPATLKNAIDYLHGEWQNKPVGMVSYGGVAAGTRAVQQLKPILAALKMVPIPEAIPIPMVGRHITDGHFTADEGLAKAASVMLDELAHWVHALAPLRTAN